MNDFLQYRIMTIIHVKIKMAAELLLSTTYLGIEDVDIKNECYKIADEINELNWKIHYAIKDYEEKKGWRE